MRFITVIALLMGLGLAEAQQQGIRLRFDIVKDGSTVAKPELVLSSGASGSFRIDQVGRIIVTPTLSGEDVSVAFEIASAGQDIKTVLGLRGDAPGTLSWTSDATNESFSLTVSRLR